MKLVSVNHASLIRTGVIVNDGEVLVLSLAKKEIPEAASLPLGLREILGLEDGLDKIQRVVAAFSSTGDDGVEKLRAQEALLDLASVSLAAVIPDPTHLMNCGAMYHQHIQEMGDLPVPEHPAFFQSSTASITGHESPVVLPRHEPDRVDYEGEFAIVIGKACYGVAPTEAMDCIAGYTIVNDISARDYVPEVMAAEDTLDAINAWGRNTAGKQHPTFSSMGPYLVTRDEIPDPRSLDLTTRLNGEIMQQVNTSDMIFDIADVVSYLSQWYALQPGDVIATGSPAGVGAARDPQVFMKDGDRIEVSISGLGTLSNPIRSASS